MYFSFSCFLFEFLVVSLKEHLLLHISVFILDFPNQIEFIKSNKEWFKMDFLHMNFNHEKVQFGVNRSFFSFPFRIRISYFDCIEKKKKIRMHLYFQIKCTHENQFDWSDSAKTDEEDTWMIEQSSLLRLMEK